MLHRIKQFIDYKKITIASFERSISMSNASFGKSLKKGKGIGSDKIENILKVYPEINTNWLLTGEGEMLKSEVKSVGPINKVSGNTSINQANSNIPKNKITQLTNEITHLKNENNLLKGVIKDKEEIIRLLKKQLP